MTCQQTISAYRQSDRALGHRMMSTLINALSSAVSAQLTEPITLGRTLMRRAADADSRVPTRIGVPSTYSTR